MLMPLKIFPLVFEQLYQICKCFREPAKLICGLLLFLFFPLDSWLFIFQALGLALSCTSPC